MGNFTATHHALLFAWISRAVINAVGEEKGEGIIRKAVVKYGMQRGKRMAMRAKANGHKLTMANYIPYGEWKAQKGEMEYKILEKVPHMKMNVFKCPWHSAWEENNLMQYGRYFCLEVDEALVRGFNEDLVLDIHGTQTNGAEFCDFTFKDANLTAYNMIGLVFKKMIKPGKKAIMPWEYHAGHLYKTIGEVITDELGEQAEKIMTASLKDFTDKYGKPAGEIVKSYENTDFDKLP